MGLYIKYIGLPEKDEDGFLKRPYIDLSVHARKTYLMPRKLEDRKAIIDFKRTVKVIDNTKDCEFIISNGFLKDSKYSDKDFLERIVKQLMDITRKNNIDRFHEYVLNIAYKVNGEQVLYTPQAKRKNDNPVLVSSNYETDKYRGFKIICNLGNSFDVGDEIEFLASLTLPVNIWDFPNEKDKFSFPVLTYDRKYIIQEEIYGGNRPLLVPSVVNCSSTVKDKDRSLYYNRYTFSSKGDDTQFKTIEIGYKMK